MPARKVKDPLAAFEKHLADQDRSANTIAGYRQDLRLFAQWFEQANGEPLTPEGITATDAREYRAYLLRAKAAPATINRKLAALRAFTAWAREAGLIETHPLNGVHAVDEQPLAPKWLTKKEQGALLKEVEREVNAARTEAAQRQAVRDQAVVTLLLNTGLRVGELCALEIGDLKLSERKGTLTVRQGKGAKRRAVPLNAAALRALHGWLEIRPDVDGAPVFIGKKGEGLMSRGVQRMLAEHGRRAGVELTPHTLRHTFAKNLVNAGVSLEKVAALLGHSNLNTTCVYTTPSALDLEQAVTQVSD